MSESATHAAVDDLARNSYGRLIAFLASRSGDVASAEDALSEAFVVALKKWPVDGVPEKPEAWLLRAARNRLIDAVRHNQVRHESETFLRQLAEEAQTVAETREHFPDERLKLLFVCAHPAVDPAARTPLMLQSVLGIDAARIASAFLVSPAAMSQRLVRAKNKIRDAAIPFRVPDSPEWTERVSFVLDAITRAASLTEDAALREHLFKRSGENARRGTKAKGNLSIWAGRVRRGCLKCQPPKSATRRRRLGCHRGGTSPRRREAAPLPLGCLKQAIECASNRRGLASCRQASVADRSSSLRSTEAANCHEPPQQMPEPNPNPG